MTAHRELKTIIRARQRKTGEAYTAARVHVMRMRAELLEPACSLPIPERERPVEGIVLKVNRDSARVRIPTEDVQVTVRSTDATEVNRPTRSSISSPATISRSSTSPM